ncbi:VOC family protein [Corticibacterium sp. UT-5YL-CI-8]|nr:VOC family protein [Tianweitania sp. UT-5YL-CI-8]
MTGPARSIATAALVVADYDAARDWYVEKLGFCVLADTDQGGGRRWLVVGVEGGTRLLLAKAADEAQTARIGDQTGGRVAFFLQTDDFARDHAAMLSKGVVFKEQPRHEAYGSVAVFSDLYGNLWDLIQYKA